ncbi:cellulose synthase operon protein YhjQ/BcsQ [Sphingobium sp.]|uniref:cellulose synthase operon protein YhjQ/BcsQ n=1 Tax=Sphingobium sp. TaxID=1912891 RepID=UPI002CB513D7|nr:cellulose synthase operon protein YhjQ/BcsQ [Sphingobium sp.]HUD91114.1 cellulose synthase operon protein YhjQ/BcsQ [Sphingobium sp.]
MALIMVQSPKGGVGSTFLAAQLSLHLASKGYEVNALDCTYQNSLKMHFGFTPTQAVPEVNSVDDEALVGFGVKLLQGYTFTRALATRTDAVRALEKLFDREHVWIVDVASEDRHLIDMLMPHCALHICPLLPTAASLATLNKLNPTVPTMKLERTVFVLNQLDDRQRLSRHSHSFIRDLFGDQLLATIRRDEAVNEALARFEPLPKYASTSAALQDLRHFAARVEERIGLTRLPEAVEAKSIGEV